MPRGRVKDQGFYKSDIVISMPEWQVIQPCFWNIIFGITCAFNKIDGLFFKGIRFGDFVVEHAKLCQAFVFKKHETIGQSYEHYKFEK